MKEQIKVHRKVSLVRSDFGTLPLVGSNSRRTFFLNLFIVFVRGNSAMSRCFPFPPPGYERKHRPGDLDLLKEAKRKEKKHKKEKKDNERTKDKEKREKDETDEKQKDKKDRKGKNKEKKEKHNDKNDKEDRSKDKDKSSISEESTVSGKLEEKCGDRLYLNGHNIAKASVVDEVKPSSLLSGQNWKKPVQSSMPSHGTEELKFVQELDRRIRDDKGRGSQLPERVSTVEKRDLGTTANTTTFDSLVEKGNNQSSRVDPEKKEHQRVRNDFDRSTMVQNLIPVGESKVEEIPRLLDRQNDRKVGDKWKDRDKKSHGKDKIKESEKTKVKSENKKPEQGTLKEVPRNGLVGVASNNKSSTDLLKGINSSADGNIRKRKDLDTNGFLHETEIIIPNKMPRPAPHELKENGTKRDIFWTQSTSYDNKHDVPSSSRVDNKDRSVNGKIEGHKPSPSKPHPSPLTIVSDKVKGVPKISESDSLNNKTRKLLKMKDEIAETSSRKKRPHPDTKYPKEVLSVPSVVDLPESDDQEWLFSKKRDDPSEKAKVVNLVGVNESGLPVWSEAVYIQSADIYALPYVIPY